MQMRQASENRCGVPNWHGVHFYGFDRGCGAQVCERCGWHKGLVRCYCGWSASGGNGYTELVEMGENIEEDY